jgi:GNAT superfamily N-acetyltransferase
MADVRLEPMTEKRYETYRQEATDFYAQSIEGSGVTHDDAVREAEESTDKLLPEGVRTPGHHLFVALDGDEEIGHIWLNVTDKARGRRAYVYDVGVRAEVRRRGYGRLIMQQAELWCRDNGVTEIGLHVYAHNPGARSLYEQLGFAETGRHMDKKL